MKSVLLPRYCSNRVICFNFNKSEIFCINHSQTKEVPNPAAFNVKGENIKFPNIFISLDYKSNIVSLCML